MSSKARFYSYSTCSTCRKALSWLNEHQIDYQTLDIVKSPPSRDLLADAINQLGDSKYLFNTSGLSYRQIGKSAIKAMSEDEVIEALYSDGKLIKRPFFVSSKGRILVGFKDLLWEEVLCAKNNL